MTATRHLLATLLGAAVLAACGARSGFADLATSAGGSGGGAVGPLGCPTESHGGHVYLFCQDHRPWADALAACQGVGMSLLTIDDASEDAWVYTVEDAISTEKAWMGLTDQAVEGTFVWASGAPVTFIDWAPGEPNGGTVENCGQINRFFPELGWNDEPCTEALHFICESP